MCLTQAIVTGELFYPLARLSSQIKATHVPESLPGSFKE